MSKTMRVFILFFAFFSFFMIFAAGPAFAVAPPFFPGQKLPSHIKKPDQAGLGSMLSPSRSGFFAPGEAIGSTKLQDYIKTNQTVKVVVIFAQFTDKTFDLSQANQDKITAFFTNFKQYFADQSGNKVTLDITPAYLPSGLPYTLAHNESYYGNSDNAVDLITDAVTAADANVNFANYQCVMVMHAGYGDETSGVSGGGTDIWSMYYWRTPSLVTTNDGVDVRGATIVPEMEHGTTSSLGIICHEFGHQFGLPDLYDTTNVTEGGIGYWSIMAAGSYNGSPSGTKPAFMDPWCRINLGWATPTNITDNQDALNFESGKVYRFEKGGATSGNDYFLAEKRGLSGSWDAGLPGEGLLIYHVDNSKSSSTTPNDTPSGTADGDVKIARLIELMVANGGNHLIVKPISNIRGLDSDPFPTGTNNKFHNTSNPSSKTWPPASANSYIGITNIVKTGSGASIGITANVVVKPKMTKVSGDAQSATVSTMYTSPLKINLAESSGGVASNQVTFAVTSGSATIIEAQPVLTDSSGNAQITLKAGANAGAVTITATATVSGSSLPAVSVTFNETVSGGASTGPTLISAAWQDVNSNASVEAGDKVVLTFDKAITLSGVAAADFTLPVTGNTFGTGASFAIGTSPVLLSITLGTGVNITVNGIFNSSVLTAGSPSGIGISGSIPAGHIADGTGNNVVTGNPAVDIAGSTGGVQPGTGPQIVSVTWQDINFNGVVDTGDRLSVFFDKSILVPGPSAADFTLPVAGDTLGTSASFAAGTQAAELWINLGSGVKITPTGVFNSSVLASGSPSGINISSTIANNHITDLSGNSARSSTAPIDIGSAVEIGDVSEVNSTVVLKNSSEQPFTADGNDTAGVEITIFDASFNAIANCDVYIKSDKNQYANIDILSPVSPAKTNSSGKVLFIIKTSQSGIRNITVEAQKTGFTKKTIGNPLQIEFKAGAVSPSLSVMTATRTQLIADGSDSAEILVNIRDVNQNPVAQKTVSLKPEPAAGVIIVPASILTDAGGNARFIIKSSQPSNNVLVSAVTDGSITLNQGINFSFTTPVISPTLSTVEIVGGSNSVFIANNQVTAIVLITVKNLSGQPISGAVPAASVSGMSNNVKNADGQSIPPAALKPTDADGKTSILITSTLAEQKKVTIVVNGVTLIQQPVLQFVSGPYDKIAYISGNDQIGTVGQQLPLGLRVQVRDAFNNGVPGQRLSFSFVSSPSGAAGHSLTDPNPVTDANGYASAKVVFGGKIGVYKVAAELSGASGSPVMFNLEAKGGPPSSIRIASGDAQNGSINMPLNNPISVNVYDAANNTLENVIVHFAQKQGSDGKPEGASDLVLSQSDSITDSTGYARTSVLKLGDKVGSYKVTASVTADPPVASAEFVLNAIAGTPGILSKVAGDLQSATAGLRVATNFKVRVQDASGNRVENCIVSFYVYHGGGTLDTESVYTNSAGEAAVGYVAGKTAGEEEVWAAVAGNYSVSGSPARFVVNVGPAPASKIVNGSYSTVLTGDAGTEITSPFSAQITDPYGNAVNNVAVTYTVKTFPDGSAGYAISRTDPTNSKSDGGGQVRCYFKLGSKVGTYEIEAASAGLTGSPLKFYAVASTGVVSADNSTVSISGNNSLADGNQQAELVVRCRDVYGNAVNNSRVIASSTPAMQSITPLSPYTDNDGYFRASLKATKSGIYKLTVNARGVELKNVPDVTFVSGPFNASKSMFYILNPPSRVLANNSDKFNVDIQIRDAYLNPVAGITPASVSINVDDDPLYTIVTPPAANSDALGIASFSVKSRRAGAKQVSVFINGQKIQTNDKKDLLELPFTVNSMDAQRSDLTVGAQIITAGSNLGIKLSPKGSNGAMIEDLDRDAFSIKLWNVSQNAYELSDITPSSTFIGADKSYNFTLLNTRSGVYEIFAELIQGQAKTSFVQRPAVTYNAAASKKIITMNSGDIYSEVAKTSGATIGIKITDEFSNPVKNAQVLFQAVSFPAGSQNTGIGNNSRFTDADGVATTSVKIGTKTGMYVFRATAYDLNSVQLSGSPVNFNAYGTPAPLARIVLNNVPASVNQYQPIRQVEAVLFDSYDNIKTDSTDKIYFTSSDLAAELPYTAQKPYIFSRVDQGRKTFSADAIIFATESQNSTLTVSNSASPNVNAVSAPVKVLKLAAEATSNFKTGSFVVPGSSNYLVFAVRSKTSLANAPTISVAFDGGSPERYDCVTSSQPRVYYKVVRVASIPFRCTLKVYGDNVYGESTIEY